MPTTPPTVHMNGTSRAELVAGYLSAYNAVRAAWDAVAATHPNGRDYYVQPPGNFSRAQAEHAARLASIESVRLELEALCLAAQGDG